MLFSISISGFAGVRGSCTVVEDSNGRPISWRLQTAPDTAKKSRKH